MSKKLKKKIEDICGLVGLDWETRQKRAEQILSNNNWKQQLCNDFQGLSFRDLELHLQGVATERQKKEEGVERKLVAHGGDNNEKPMRGDSAKSGRTIKAGTGVKPRTLEEILRQVHAPRVESEGFTRKELEGFGVLGKRSGPEILPDTPDDDDQTGD